MRGFIGIDLETTGLAVNSDILEIGAVLFDRNLRELDYVEVLGPTNAGVQRVHNDELDPFIRDMHTKSGLIDEINAMQGANLKGLGKFHNVLEHWVEKLGGKVPMLGASVHMDRQWLAHHFPEIHDLFSYRNIDASSFRELALVTNPDIAEGVLKRATPGEASHRAIDDVRASAKTIRALASRTWTHAPWAVLRSAEEGVEK